MGYHRRNRRNWGNFNTGSLYRSRHGEIFGVCQGIADWRDLPVGPIRLIVIILTVTTGFFPVGVIYLILGIILPIEPDGYNEEEERFYYRENEKNFKQRYKKSKEDIMNDIKHEFNDMKDRVSRMEDTVINKEKDWEERFKKG